MQLPSLKLPVRWRRQRPTPTLPLVLGPHSIYILPSRAGWGLGIVLLCMLLAAINYSLNLGFLLTFVIVGMALSSMLHTWRNLAWLQVNASAPAPVFAGQHIQLQLELSDKRQRARYAVGAALALETVVYTDIAAGHSATLTLSLASKQRGWMQVGPIALSTSFPAGLFRVWTSFPSPLRCLIYPTPAEPGLPLPEGAIPGGSEGETLRRGDDDFSGLRPYQAGDSPRRIDWKASSREQGLYSRDFHAAAHEQCWLDLAQTPGKNLEHRLSQLTRWVMDAHEQSLSYGLQLPGFTLEPAHGEAHYHACLRALALLGQR